MQDAVTCVAPPSLDPGSSRDSPSPSPDAAAITADQLEAIAVARRRARKILRASHVASFGGWTLACFACISLLSGLFDLRSLLLGIGLAGVAFVELRGARRLRGFDTTAPRWLAANQGVLAVVVCVYAGWGIAEAILGPGVYDAHIAGGGPIAEQLEPIDRLMRLITVAVYAAVIAGSLVAQGLVSIYYLTRRSHMIDYLGRTPDWVVETLRRASG